MSDRLGRHAIHKNLDEQHRIVGFYSLSSFTLTIADLPPVYSRHLPPYDLIPAALIGRLARDERVRGEGVGDLLLADAVRKVISVSRSLAVFSIVVEALDKKAAAFYRDFGFAPFPSRPLRLFMAVPAARVAEQALKTTR